ncbi:MAG: hypothetical protein OSB21_04455 [Myxococcota bacterium]|jgi:hypothetical protein|nr:hypothetical protein [Myxococcota bacterium]
MSRIGHNVPLEGLEHVTKMLKDSAGKDGIISRADAEKLGQDLRKNGQGTEALAAGKVFRMVDKFEDAPGARVTGSDLDQARSFVETELLESADTNRNGYSQAELKTMPATGRALVEIGLKLRSDAADGGGRVAHRIPELGLQHTAEMLKQAAGADQITSRDDREALIGNLYSQGRGTEALAASYFFSFIDARDHETGARVTTKDIDRAVDYASERLLKNKDTNHNGYSQKEIGRFSTSAKAFLEVGKLIDAGIIKAD